MRHRRSGIIRAWISGLLCLASLVMWGRGEWGTDDLTCRSSYHVTSLVSGRGGLHLLRCTLDFTQPQWMKSQGQPPPQPAPEWSWQLRHGEYGADDDDLGWLKFFPSHGPPDVWVDSEIHRSMWADEIGPSSAAWSLRIPWWPIVLLTAIWPGLKLIQIARTRRPHQPGCCPRCGYDLRATPTRCPECGYVMVENVGRKSET